MSSLVITKIGTILGQIPSPLLIPVVTVLLVGTLTWAYYRMVRGNYDVSMYNKIPGPKYDIPFLGNALTVTGPPDVFLRVMKNFTDTYGQVMRFTLAHRPYVVLSGAKGYETILSSNKHITKGPDYKFLHPWLGLGLLTSDGAKWHSRRKMLTPAFHFKILEDFLVVMNEQTKILTDKLSNMREDEVDMFPNITYCALDIICQTAMGKNCGAQLNSDSEYVQSIFRASEMIFERNKNPILWNSLLFKWSPVGYEFDSILKVLHKFTDDVIQDRKAEYKANKGQRMEEAVDEFGRKKRLAFLDLLIDASDDGKQLTDLEIREEVDTFMFEGHDTTAANMTFSVYLLASHPEVQKKVQAELDDIFEGDIDRPCTMEDLSRMKYLEAVIKESLRLFPSVPMMTRKLHEDTMIQDHMVPKDTNIFLFNYALQRDPEQFPDPDAFDPDRFVENSGAKKRHPYAYVPFSAGPRNCIGQKFAMMEEKVTISSVLRNFNLTTDLDLTNLEVLPEIILRPKSGIPVKLESRRK